MNHRLYIESMKLCCNSLYIRAKDWLKDTFTDHF